MKQVIKLKKKEKGEKDENKAKEEEKKEEEKKKLDEEEVDEIIEPEEPFIPLSERPLFDNNLKPDPVIKGGEISDTN